MAIRYYVGDRLIGGDTETTYHSAVEQWVFQNLGISNDGTRQIISHALPIVIERYDLTVAQHNALIAALPAVQSFNTAFLSNTLGSLTTAQQNVIRDRMNAAGFDVTWATGDTTVRQLLRALADTVQLCEKVSAASGVALTVANFNVGNKTVGDLTPAQRVKLLDILAALGIQATGTLATPLSEVVDLMRAWLKDFE